MSRQDLLGLEGAGRLIYCSPLAPNELDEIELPDGRFAKAIRPAIPQGWDFKERRFVNHYTETPKVCAGLLARMATLRGLGHSVHHPELTRMEQCHGWIYDLDGSENPIGEPYLCATSALDKAVRSKANRISAWGYDLGVPTAPFEPFPLQPHQYRSPEAIEPLGAYEIDGRDWPEDVVIIRPFDQYASYQDWREDVLLKIGR